MSALMLSRRGFFKAAGVVGAGLLVAYYLNEDDQPVPLSCLLYTSPSPRDKRQSRMPSSA